MNRIGLGIIALLLICAFVVGCTNTNGNTNSNDDPNDHGGTENVQDSDNDTTEVEKSVEPEVRDGFQIQTVEFPYNTSEGDSAKVKLTLALPTNWSISYDYNTYELIPFKEYADFKFEDDYVGGIGFIQYELPDDQDIPVEGIFNQIAMGSMTFWYIRQHFDIVTEESLPYCTAITSVVYSSKVFPDGKERSNSGIVTYHPGYKMYFTLELNDGNKDREILTAEEIRYIAESMEWQPLG